MPSKCIRKKELEANKQFHCQSSVSQWHGLLLRCRGLMIPSGSISWEGTENALIWPVLTFSCKWDERISGSGQEPSCVDADLN